MEKTIENLSIFENYSKRQVILNYYQDNDFLYRRDGFEFESIQVINEDLVFLKKGSKTVLTIETKDYTQRLKSSEFQNYYIFREGCERLEIYFP